MSNPVIIPVHNALPLTRLALKSLRKQTIPVSILIVDDGSEDETRLAMLAESVSFVRSPQPKGVTWAWNTGLDYYFRSGCEHVLVVNNDVQLRPDTYELLLADGGDFVSGISVNRMEDMARADPKSRAPHPDFSCFLIRKACWDKVGAFDPTMKIYAADNDYHVRLHRAGIEASAIAVPFYHERSSTIKLASNEDRDRIQRIADADRARFKEKYGCMPWEPAYADLFKCTPKE